MKKRIYIKVSGVVQGVGFRASTLRQARTLNLTGYVKNLQTGEVEIVAEGEERDIIALLEWSKKGPPGSVVSKVEHKIEEFSGKFKEFKIEY